MPSNQTNGFADPVLQKAFQMEGWKSMKNCEADGAGARYGPTRRDFKQTADAPENGFNSTTARHFQLMTPS